MVRNKIEKLLREQPRNQRSVVPYGYQETCLVASIFYLYGGKAKILRKCKKFEMNTRILGHYERRGSMPYARAIELSKMFHVPTAALSFKEYKAAGGWEDFGDVAAQALAEYLEGEAFDEWFAWIMSKPSKWEYNETGNKLAERA